MKKSERRTLNILIDLMSEELEATVHDAKGTSYVFAVFMRALLRGVRRRVNS